jgi:hypothetical protein
MVALGLNIPNFGPTATPATLRGWVRFAERHGFDVAMMSDHVAATADVTALYPPQFYDPFTTLAWLAGFTTRLLLGMSVTILPYRHPLLTARLSATIDGFIDGRFVLGVGVGWSGSSTTHSVCRSASAGGSPMSTSRPSSTPGPATSSPTRARRSPTRTSTPAPGCAARPTECRLSEPGRPIDTNSDDPADRRPTADDWRTLATIADELSGVPKS